MAAADTTAGTITGAGAAAGRGKAMRLSARSMEVACSSGDDGM